MDRYSRQCGIMAIDSLLKEAQTPAPPSRELPPEHPVARLAQTDLARLQEMLPSQLSPDIVTSGPVSHARTQYYQMLQQLYDKYVAPFNRQDGRQSTKGPAVEDPPRVVSVPK